MILAFYRLRRKLCHWHSAPGKPDYVTILSSLNKPYCYVSCTRSSRHSVGYFLFFASLWIIQNAFNAIILLSINNIALACHCFTHRQICFAFGSGVDRIHSMVCMTKWTCISCRAGFRHWGIGCQPHLLHFSDCLSGHPVARRGSFLCIYQLLKWNAYAESPDQFSILNCELVLLCRANAILRQYRFTFTIYWQQTLPGKKK